MSGPRGRKHRRNVGENRETERCTLQARPNPPPEPTMRKGLVFRQRAHQAIAGHPTSWPLLLLSYCNISPNHLPCGCVGVALVCWGHRYDRHYPSSCCIQHRWTRKHHYDGRSLCRVAVTPCIIATPTRQRTPTPIHFGGKLSMFAPIAKPMIKILYPAI